MRILLIVSGSVAAYKALELTRLLRRDGRMEQREVLLDPIAQLK